MADHDADGQRKEDVVPVLRMMGAEGKACAGDVCQLPAPAPAPASLDIE
jgi:hypothetical protein